MGARAVRPERTSTLILANTIARLVVADDYPIGMPLAVAEAIVAWMYEIWGTEVQAMLLVPSPGR
jgi:hypothetical protein